VPSGSSARPIASRVAMTVPINLTCCAAGRSSLSFGWGSQACVGATLALLETEMVFGRLMKRWPNLVLAGGAPQWRRNPLYRGLSMLRGQRSA